MQRLSNLLLKCDTANFSKDKEQLFKQRAKENRSKINSESNDISNQKSTYPHQKEFLAQTNSANITNLGKSFDFTSNGLGKSNNGKLKDKQKRRFKSMDLDGQNNNHRSNPEIVTSSEQKSSKGNSKSGSKSGSKSSLFSKTFLGGSKNTSNNYNNNNPPHNTSSKSQSSNLLHDIQNPSKNNKKISIEYTSVVDFTTRNSEIDVGFDENLVLKSKAESNLSKDSSKVIDEKEKELVKKKTSYAKNTFGNLKKEDLDHYEDICETQGLGTFCGPSGLNKDYWFGLVMRKYKDYAKEPRVHKNKMTATHSLHI